MWDKFIGAFLGCVAGSLFFVLVTVLTDYIKGRINDKTRN